jgi:hypothetical protein
MLDCINGEKYYLKNGYTDPIPSGSIVLVHMCHAQLLPAYVLNRKDIRKILYTIESPNIRHKEQWSGEFIERYFTDVITYWEDIRYNVRMYRYPFIHRLNMKVDKKYLSKNKEKGTICIVLENRKNDQRYKIDGIELKAQDKLREEYVREMPEIYCYGRGWKEIEGKKDMYIEHKEENHDRSKDTRKSKDYYQKHRFALIIENCNAKGYVSEKIFDAWMVGTIPIYYGNMTERYKKKMGITDEMYIDAKKYSAKELGERMKNITKEEIEKYEEEIYKRREDVLENVGIEKYNRYLEFVFES